MTTPINNPGPAVVNPDGTTNYGASVPAAAGTTTIWNLPSDLNNKVIYFDTGYTHAPVKSHEGPFQDKYSTGAINGSFDQNQPVTKIMDHYAAMSRNDPMLFAALQKELLDAGFYGPPGTTVLGGMKQQTQDALIKAMHQYLQVSSTGTADSFTKFLASEAAANIGINGNAPGAGGTGSSAPLLTDPDTLSRYAQMAAQNALGRALTKNELTKFVDQFHNEQINSYTQAAGHNGLSSQKDDPRSSAINFVTSNNTQEFGQHQIQGYTDTFLNMFLPQGSAAPNVSVDPTAVGF